MVAQFEKFEAEIGCSGHEDGLGSRLVVLNMKLTEAYARHVLCRHKTYAAH